MGAQDPNTKVSNGWGGPIFGRKNKEHIDWSTQTKLKHVYNDRGARKVLVKQESCPQHCRRPRTSAYVSITPVSSSVIMHYRIQRMHPSGMPLWRLGIFHPLGYRISLLDEEHAQGSNAIQIQLLKFPSTVYFGHAILAGGCSSHICALRILVI